MRYCTEPARLVRERLNGYQEPEMCGCADCMAWGVTEPPVWVPAKPEQIDGVWTEMAQQLHGKALRDNLLAAEEYRRALTGRRNSQRQAGRSGPTRPSLPTLIRHARTEKGAARMPGSIGSDPLLPTLTRCGNYNRKGASPTSGDGLATAVGGRLNPTWCEWYMGFPLGFTDVEWPPASRPSGTRSSRRKSNGSAVD